MISVGLITQTMEHIFLCHFVDILFKELLLNVFSPSFPEEDKANSERDGTRKKMTKYNHKIYKEK